MTTEVPEITIPEFPPTTEWINARAVPIRTLLGRHVILVWFWDYSSLNSLRALPYVKAWHERYADKGLEVLGVHSPQFDFGKQRDNVAAACERLGIEFKVAPDPDYDIWGTYGNEVWPALYLWDRTGKLRYLHFAEGEYQQSEMAIGELLREIDDRLELPEPMAPIRATDVPGAAIAPPTPHIYLSQDRLPKAVEAGDELSVSFQGAGAAAVLNGRGRVDLVVDGEPVRTLELEGPRLYELIEDGPTREHELSLRFRNEALAYAFSFAPGVAETQR